MPRSRLYSVSASKTGSRYSNPVRGRTCEAPGQLGCIAQASCSRGKAMTRAVHQSASVVSNVSLNHFPSSSLSVGTQWHRIRHSPVLVVDPGYRKQRAMSFGRLPSSHRKVQSCWMGSPSRDSSDRPVPPVFNRKRPTSNIQHPTSDLTEAVNRLATLPCLHDFSISARDSLCSTTTSRPEPTLTARPFALAISPHRIAV